VCQHTPPCPAADASDEAAARLDVFYANQGWGRRCNGALTFEDGGELLPGGQIITPNRMAAAA
jgi:hypothetical protein